MNTTGLRVVLDTNILIAIIGRKSPFRWIFDQLLAGQLILCVSNEILLEYQEILARQTSREVADNFSNFLTIHPFVEKVEIFYQFRLISEDGFLICLEFFLIKKHLFFDLQILSEQ
jgi:predicted nucleic acid-binding protein